MQTESLLKKIWKQHMQEHPEHQGMTWCVQSSHPWRPDGTICQPCAEWAREVIGE